MKPVLSSKYMKCAHRSCVSLREQDKAIPMVGSLGNKAPHYRARQKARAFSQEQQVRQVWGEVTPRRRDGWHDTVVFLNITSLSGLLHTT